MGNVLSQDEVDSLLDGISDGKVKTETDTPERGKALEVYDFTMQAGPRLNSLPALGIINERFVGFSGESLSAATRSDINVTTSSVEWVRFGQFCSSIQLPASLNIFKMEPLQGLALLVLEGPLVFALVDTFFGGKARGQDNLEGKEFTAIETRIIEKVVATILSDLEHAWSDVHKVKAVFKRSEVDPRFTAIVKPNDAVMVKRFTIELENTSGGMAMCIPCSTIEPIREKLRGGVHSEKVEIDQRWRRFIEERIRELTVNVRCTLGTTRITGRELLAMKVDDVLPLEQGVNDLISVSVEGVEKFKGYPGTRSNKQAIRIREGVYKE
jgi:flagellar motor switch protein FliM